jgi:hypothetical protein
MLVTLHQNVESTQVPRNHCKKKVASYTDIMLLQCGKRDHGKGRNAQKMKIQLLEPWPKIISIICSYYCKFIHLMINHLLFEGR